MNTKLQKKIENANDSDELVTIIADFVEQELKGNYIKTMVQGFEVAMTLMRDYCDEHTPTEIKAFCEQNLERKNLAHLVKIINDKK